MTFRGMGIVRHVWDSAVTSLIQLAENNCPQVEDWLGLITQNGRRVRLRKVMNPVMAESVIDEMVALSALENIQYFYNVLKKAFLKY